MRLNKWPQKNSIKFMPRGYDDYLMGSLCQSPSDDEIQGNISSHVTRRSSIGSSLPKIPIRVEGSGVVVNMKVGPHVRWTKILAKWTSSFPSLDSAPLAWPVRIDIEGVESLMIASIQESISRSIGPELLEQVSERNPALIVRVGKFDRTDPIEDVTQPADVLVQDGLAECQSEPSPLVESKSDSPTEKRDQEPDPIEDVPMETTASGSRVMRIKVESKLVTKPLKLNVSSNCTVSRLIRKWSQALKSTINSDIIDLMLPNGRVLDLEMTLSQALPGIDPGRIVLEAIVRGSLEEDSPPKTKRKRSRKQERTPPTTAAKSISSAPDLDSQQEELLFWQQVRKTGDDGLAQVAASDFEDDELAIAIALSLSEEIK
jgi:hypothetical protein